MKTLFSKAFSFIAATLLATTATFCLTSCGDDDDELEQADNSKVGSGYVLLDANPTADMLKYCDLEMSVTDELGVSKVFPVDSQEFSTKYQLTRFPITVTIKYTLKLKSGATPADDALVKYTTKSSYYVNTYGANGKAIESKGGQHTSSMDYTGKAFVERIGGRPDIWSKTYTIGADGLVIN